MQEVELRALRLCLVQGHAYPIPAQAMLGPDVHHLARENQTVSVSSGEFKKDLVPCPVPFLRQYQRAGYRKIADSTLTPPQKHAKKTSVAHPLSSEGALCDFVPGVPAIRSVHPVLPQLVIAAQSPGVGCSLSAETAFESEYYQRITATLW